MTEPYAALEKVIFRDVSLKGFNIEVEKSEREKFVFRIRLSYISLQEEEWLLPAQCNGNATH